MILELAWHFRYADPDWLLETISSKQLTEWIALLSLRNKEHDKAIKDAKRR